MIQTCAVPLNDGSDGKAMRMASPSGEVAIEVAGAKPFQSRPVCDDRLPEVDEREIRLRPPPISPLENASVFSRLTWWFVERFLTIGSLRQLRAEDLDVVRECDSAEVLRQRLRDSWRDEIVLAASTGRTATAATATVLATAAAVPVRTINSAAMHPSDRGVPSAASSSRAVSFALTPPQVQMQAVTVQPASASASASASSPRSDGDVGGGGGGGANGDGYSGAPSRSNAAARPFPLLSRASFSHLMRPRHDPNSARPYRPSLFRAVARAFGFDFALIGLLAVLYSVVKILQTVFLKEIVTFIMNAHADSPPPVWQGYMWAVLLGTAVLAQGFIHHQYFFSAQHSGVQCRIALTGLIFDKSLSLSTASFLSTTTGQVVNLISNDAYKPEEVSPFLHFLWVAPLETALVTILLYQQIGPACFAGLACMFLLIPVQTFFARQFGTIRKRTLKYTDRRVKTINEMLVGCEVMKMYNWEDPMSRVVTRARDREFEGIRHAAVFKAINQAINFFCASVVCFVAFSVYMAISPDKSLQPADIFATVALFQIVRFPMTNFLPFAVEKSSEMKVSLERITRFLLLGGMDVPPLAAAGSDYEKGAAASEKGGRTDSAAVEVAVAVGAVSVEHATFAWHLHSSDANDGAGADAGQRSNVTEATSITTCIEGPAREPPNVSAVPSGVALSLPAASPRTADRVQRWARKKRRDRQTVRVPSGGGQFLSLSSASALARASAASPKAAKSPKGGSADAAGPFATAAAASAGVGVRLRSPVGVIEPVHEDGDADTERDRATGRDRGRGGDDVRAAEDADVDGKSDADNDKDKDRDRDGDGDEDEDEDDDSADDPPSFLHTESQLHARADTADIPRRADGNDARRRRSADFLAPMTEPDLAVTLRNVTFQVRPGELIAVVGAIGSSKSSLLAAVLGEMDKLEGSVRVGGRVSFAAQKPWIFAASVRENIVFGKPFDAQRYAAVVAACELTEDLHQLDESDHTIIGERGVNLSGGQKARVALARAVYADADVYLFDDPLSAVDVLVGRKLFDQVFGPKGCLRGRTRLLVTHQVQFLGEVDQVLVLERGRIKIADSLANMAARGLDAALMSAVTSTAAPTVVNATSPKEPAAEKKSATLEAAMTGPSGSNTNPKVLAKSPTARTKGIIEEEERRGGALSTDVLLDFVRGMGGGWVAAAMLFSMVIGQAALVVNDYWLSYWSQQDPSVQHDAFYQNIYAILITATVVTAGCRALVCFRVILQGSYDLHANMFRGVLFASLRFFEANPVGRVLNRFSKDQSIVDEMMPITFYDFTQATFMVLGALIVIAVVNPYTLVVLVFVVPLFVYIRKRYMTSSREIKRLDSVSRSPIYAHFSSTLSGLMTVRAFGAQDAFSSQFLRMIDDNTRCFLAFMTSSRWLGFRLDFISSCVVFTTAILAVVQRGTINPSSAGFALSYSLMLCSLFQWVVRQSAELENNFTSVERIVSYSKLAPEGMRVIPDNRPPPDWPEKGLIEIKDLKVRYREGLDLVLRGIDATILPQEKVGVCGRTGAGKSSLFGAFFRLMEACGGSIVIDGYDVSKIGLSDLRSQLSIIPQNPVVFSGTLRYNLDPFRRCSSELLWEALEAVQLREMVVGLPDQLDTRIAEFGSNFSIGEAQLICVARALLKPSKILFVDEATASVDTETDRIIQRVIRDQFRNRTVITIAHRLNTIIDSDKIMVLGAGRVVEFDTPANLLANPDGVFASMSKDAHLH